MKQEQATAIMTLQGRTRAHLAGGSPPEAASRKEVGQKPATSRHLSSRLRGGLLVGIGYLLSPLSWWNDAALNIPLAWVLASLGEHLIPVGFPVLFVGFYWLTNIAGFVLLHLGGKELFGTYFAGRSWLTVIVTTLLYTAAILLLLKKGILGPLPIQL